MLNFYCCLGCSGPCSLSEYFCAVCKRDLAKSLFARSFDPTFLSGVPVYSYGKYEGVFAKLIARSKKIPYGLIDECTRRFFEELLEHHQEFLQRISCDVVVSAPSHPLRAFFESDLSALIGASLCKLLKRPQLALVKSTFKRTLNFYSQQKFKGRAERRQIAGNREYRIQRVAAYAGARVLIVDDVATTGATLRCLWDMLVKAGYRPVAALVLARTPQVRLTLPHGIHLQDHHRTLSD